MFAHSFLQQSQTSAQKRCRMPSYAMLTCMYRRRYLSCSAYPIGCPFSIFFLVLHVLFLDGRVACCEAPESPTTSLWSSSLTWVHWARLLNVWTLTFSTNAVVLKGCLFQRGRSTSCYRTTRHWSGVWESSLLTSLLLTCYAVTGCRCRTDVFCFPIGVSTHTFSCFLPDGVHAFLCSFVLSILLRHTSKCLCRCQVRVGSACQQKGERRGSTAGYA